MQILGFFLCNGKTFHQNDPRSKQTYLRPNLKCVNMLAKMCMCIAHDITYFITQNTCHYSICKKDLKRAFFAEIYCCRASVPLLMYSFLISSQFVYRSTFLCKPVPPRSQPIQICCTTITNMQTKIWYLCTSLSL